MSALFPAQARRRMLTPTPIRRASAAARGDDQRILNRLPFAIFFPVQREDGYGQWRGHPPADF